MNAETENLWNEWESHRTLATRNRLVESYMPLVRMRAARMSRSLPPESIVDFGDLVGFGSLGLIEAVERFEPGRGFQFPTFASRRIHGAMLDGLRGADLLSRTERRKVKAGQRREPKPIGLHHVVGKDDDGRVVRMVDTMIDCAADSPQATIELQDEGRSLLRGLSTRKRLLLLLYYSEECSMKSIGEQLGISESRVSQIHSQLIGYLRNRFQPQTVTP